MAGEVSSLVLFGATGDLAMRMLLPSLYSLDYDNLLPSDLAIIGSARADMDDLGFRQLARSALEAHLPDGLFNLATAERFLGRLAYVSLDIADTRGFDRLADRIADREAGIAIYLSTAPSLFEAAIAGLKSSGLASTNVRLALEKPLGSDLASSREINDSVAGAFPEERTFRIDHYLGKETVQNLLALRFANSLFEPLWNASHIDHVRITVAEAVGLENRGGYYDQAGALRDMVQNHILQLLALVAMEPPADFDATDIRDEKVKVLRALHPMTAANAKHDCVLGQYAAGTVAGVPVESYVDDLGRPSATETFVEIEARIDNWRWAGVPFHLRTGKRLAERKTEIFIQFRDVPHSIFASRGAHAIANKLIIAIQPEENIRLLLMAKTPGLDRDGIRLREVPLDVGMAGAFADHRRRIAYERLLLDLIEGNPTLFVRRDEVEAQWAWIDGVRAAWTEAGLQPELYAAGSWGPGKGPPRATPDEVRQKP